MESYLKDQTCLSEIEITEILFLEPKITNFLFPAIKKNFEFLLELFQLNSKDPKTAELLKEYPILLSVSKEYYQKISHYFTVYLKEEGISQNDLDDLYREHPLVLSVHNQNLWEYLEILKNLKTEVITACEWNLENSRIKRDIDRKDFFKVKTLGEEKVSRDISNPIDVEISKFRIFDFIKLNPYALLTEPKRFNEIFSVFKERLGIDKQMTLHLMKRCPDIMYLNRKGLVNRKVDLLLGMMNENRFTVKGLIKAYPFILVKSFSSLIKKFSFLKNDCGYNLDNDLSIYPLLLVFNFEKEIKPKLTILNRIEKAHLGNEENNVYNKGKVISVKKAFSISKTDFCTSVNIPEEEYTSLEQNSAKTDGESLLPNFEERDILFYYSKWQKI
eukprot:CAMPEP_0170515792 /NCGR_PEP_ID=MMETSP0209-20121228/2190_1 /TAXON_ID=665100 ORGANISM="Litonotus pictus, Strain P1" /NCGR_SAMPLE_ID=MMETSP0209 /ASSEMBLY_ACC=CAM_ASM_000301 /LENGTH=387 /DNA_ID=CAMNT_0010800449 /DNA_START=279 /DNA_END=1445 /DNA_ORIENTATION=-